MKVTPGSEPLYSWEYPDIVRASYPIMLELIKGGVPYHDDVPTTAIRVVIEARCTSHSGDMRGEKDRS
jgi:hypothetical protein